VIVESYTTLQTAIAGWLTRSEASLGGFIPGFIQSWESRFYRQPQNFGRWMETELSETIASNVIAVPSDYLGLKHAFVDGSYSTPLDRKTLVQMYSAYPRGGCTGIPVWITRERGNFIFGPAPDSDYDIGGTYWARPINIRSFASDAAAHWLIVNAPDLVLYGSLLESTPFLRNDARIGVWQSFYDKALQDYRDLQKDEDVSGSPNQEMLA
jgi:hypothetical protein